MQTAHLISVWYRLVLPPVSAFFLFIHVRAKMLLAKRVNFYFYFSFKGYFDVKNVAWGIILQVRLVPT